MRRGIRPRPPRLAFAPQQDGEAVVAARQSAAELGDGGIVVGQLPEDRHHPSVLDLRGRRLAHLIKQAAEVVATECQAGAEFGGGGVVVGQLPVDRDRASVLGLRHRFIRRRREDAKIVVALRQAAVELGDAGVVVGQPPSDRDRASVLGLRCHRLAHLMQQLAQVVVASRRLLWNSVTPGLSSASLRRIAIALRYSASAATGWLIPHRMSPMRWTVSASSRRASFEVPGAETNAP